MYTPISQRENIEDEDIAKIADYLERHTKSFLFGVNIIQFDDFTMHFWCGDAIIRKYTQEVIISMPTRMLAELIPGVYGILKHNK